jgi:hypothetical protein
MQDMNNYTIEGFSIATQLQAVNSNLSATTISNFVDAFNPLEQWGISI